MTSENTQHTPGQQNDFACGYRLARDYPVSVTQDYPHPENAFQRGWNAGRVRMPRSVLTAAEWERLLAKLTDEQFDRFLFSGALSRRMDGDASYNPTEA